jgi:Ser/Thr protein kinase RdoA (MazF antagonist)
MELDEAARIFEPAARRALAAFPVEPRRLELVSLSENATFKVATDAGDYVLRLHRPGYHTRAELDSERMWIRALLDADIAVPRPLRARDGADFVEVAIDAFAERRCVGVSSWTDGEMLARVLRHRKDAHDLERFFAQIGGIAASMHSQSVAWRVPAGFRRHALDADGLVGEAPFWGRFWEHPALSLGERRLLDTTRHALRAALERYARAPTTVTTYGLIHADLHPGNLVLDGDRLTAIDFDDAGFGWHAYDIAVALFQFRDAPNYAALEAAFVAGYRAVRPLTEATRATLPMFSLIRALAIIGWIHQRPELDRAAYLRDMKDRICAQCAAFEAPC